MRLNQLDCFQKNLPAQPDILGREHWMNSSVLILFTRQQDELYFVLEKRAAHIRQGGEICFPGGRFDPDQDSSFLDTALREAEEELLIDPKKIRVLGKFPRVVSALGSVIEAFPAYIEPEDLDISQFDRREVEAVFLEPVWFFEQNDPQVFFARLAVEPFEWENGERKLTFPARSLGLPESYENSWGHTRHEILVYPQNQCRVWGLTARLIQEVVRRIY